MTHHHLVRQLRLLLTTNRSSISPTDIAYGLINTYPIVAMHSMAQALSQDRQRSSLQHFQSLQVLE